MKKKTHEKTEPWVNLHGEFVDGKFVDEKYHQYTTLIITPKLIDILVNETGLSDFELKKYIATTFFKEENDIAREHRNKKARERRQKNGSLNEKMHSS